MSLKVAPDANLNISLLCNPTWVAHDDDEVATALVVSKQTCNSLSDVNKDISWLQPDPIFVHVPSCFLFVLIPYLRLNCVAWYNDVSFITISFLSDRKLLTFLLYYSMFDKLLLAHIWFSTLPYRSVLAATSLQAERRYVAFCPAKFVRHLNGGTTVGYCSIRKISLVKD